MFDPAFVKRHRAAMSVQVKSGFRNIGKQKALDDNHQFSIGESD
jgi:hypothetical protein